MSAIALRHARDGEAFVNDLIHQQIVPLQHRVQRQARVAARAWHAAREE